MGRVDPGDKSIQGGLGEEESRNVKDSEKERERGPIRPFQPTHNKPYHPCYAPPTTCLVPFPASPPNLLRSHHLVSH